MVLAITKKDSENWNDAHTHTHTWQADAYQDICKQSDTAATSVSHKLLIAIFSIFTEFTNTDS